MTHQTKGKGLFVAAAAALAAGAYWLYGSKDAEKNRRTVKGWMLHARADILERMEKMREWKRESFDKVVDDVMDRYEPVANATKDEFKKMKQELKDAWQHIQESREDGDAVTKSRRVARKVKVPPQVNDIRE